jgi:hypothetical protein
MIRRFTQTQAILTLVALSLITTTPARSDDVYTIIVKKQQEKEKKRWYLTDWFEAKEKIRLMDMWLALHSPSPYEFFVGTDYRVSDDQKSSYPGDFRIRAAAYASIFGLEMTKTAASGGETLGLFDLRVFGYHVQSTNITLQGGIRSEGSPAYRSAVAGVASTIYIMKPFGIDGYWRHYFSSTPNSTGDSVEGNRYEFGPFLDFSFVRFEGGYFHETLDTSGISPSDSAHSGAFLGTQVFF